MAKLPKKHSKLLRLRYTANYGKQHGDARTLSPSYIGKNKSGWRIEGKVHEDYYEWVNEFKAFHPKHGRVEGNFESIVQASSKKALTAFLSAHPYSEWDYGDI